MTQLFRSLHINCTDWISPVLKVPTPVSTAVLGLVELPEDVSGFARCMHSLCSWQQQAYVPDVPLLRIWPHGVSVVAPFIVFPAKLLLFKSYYFTLSQCPAQGLSHTYSKRGCFHNMPECPSLDILYSGIEKNVFKFAISDKYQR